ncbi:MAG: hypothetical protein ACI9HE_003611, partial [Planctomycetota bacterium]
MRPISNLLALLSLVLAACSGGSQSTPAPAGSGQLSVLVTDAPFEHDIVEQALI